MASKRKASVLLHKETVPATPAATLDATTSGENNSETDPYAGLMKDADKLKLMLLAWNYQNSNAVRNGTEGPDLSVVGGLWAQYQNALAQSAAATSSKIETSLSPVGRADVSSPMEAMEAQDETNSSGQKEEDEGSEDDSDDKLDEKLAPHDPERLKAFNMFVRLFVDENLDRIVPISKQPKEKIQAIIDSCARQFPEFSDRSRKRIRTYLKSCRRNKKTREGWDNSTRPTPAHLTSVQAEQILAIACENESMNAKRMRIGLEPITHAIPAPGSAVAAAVAATSSSGSAASSTITSASVNESTNVVSTLPFSTALGFAPRSTPNSETTDSLTLTPTSAATVGATGNCGSLNSARSSPLTGMGNNINNNNSICGLDIKMGNVLSNGSGAGSNNANGSITTLAGMTTNSPLYRTTDFTAAATSSAATSPFVAAAAAAVAGRTLSGYTQYFQNAAAGLGSVTPTDLSMKPAVSSSVTAALNTLNSNMQLNNNVTSAALSNIIGSTVGLSNTMNNNNMTSNNLVTATQQLQQLQQQQQHHQHQQQQQQQQQAAAAVAQLAGQTNISSSLAGAIEASLALRGPPLIPHKLSQSEIAAARSVVHAYRESASFLMRTADHIDQMLLTQQQQQQQHQQQQQ